MIGHLSSEQISEFAVGQPSPLLAKHVQNCPACRAELGNFRAALGEYRGAVRAWSEERANSVLVNPAANDARPSWTSSHQLAWALLLAAVCIIASFVIPRHQEGISAGSDAVLLNRVDVQVSRTVPSSMEPLLKLVVQE